MRRPFLAAVVAVVAGTSAGCLIDRGAIGGNAGLDVAADRADAWIAETTDAPRPDTNTDAYLDPSTDAWEPDAFVEMPDAFREPPDAWSPPGADAWSADAATCSGPRCEGNELVDCAGMRTPCVVCGATLAMTTPHCLTLVPSNTPPMYAVSTDRSAIDAVFDGNTFDWDTSGCMRGRLRIAGGRELHGSQVTRATVGGVEVCIVGAANFVLDAGTTIVVHGDLPLVLVAGESFEMPAGARITVASWNDGSGTGCSPDTTGAGALLDPASPGAGQPGRPEPGGGSGDGAGGGGGFCGRGGNGGNGTGSAPGGMGATSPSVTLVPLRGGSPGGAGVAGDGDGGGFGGMGGGALQISAPRLVMRGLIEAFGANGGGGARPSGNSGSGGGGGSGGGVHLEALALDVTGGTIDVRGGGGGGGSCLDNEGSCGGLEARPAAISGGAGGVDCGGRGGVGAAGTALGGGGGESDFNGGGGGGGAGCVVLRNHSAAPTIATVPSAPGVLGVAPPTVR